MSPPDPIPGLARDAPLAALIFAAMPAWLWSSDGEFLWCNAAAAALFGAESADTLVAEPPHTLLRAGREIAAQFPHLPVGGTPQLVRLLALAHSGFTRPPTCSCRRIRAPGGRLKNGATCILATAIEPARTVLPLSERVRRALSPARHLAAFGSNGVVLYAGASFEAILNSRQTLDALVAATTAAEALRTGSATAQVDAGSVRLERFGQGDETVLVAHLTVAAGRAAAPEPQRADNTSRPENSTCRSGEAVGGAAPERDELMPAGDPEAERSPAVGSVRFLPPASGPQPGSPLTEREDRLSDLTLLNQVAERLVQRRHPLRFIWTMSADDRFTIEPGEFITLVGEPTASVQGRPWREAAEVLGIDPEGRVTAAIALRETWSGVIVDWPAEDVAETLPIILSGLPSVGPDRSFRGYRGFGVCRDVGRIAALVDARRGNLNKPDASESPTQKDIVSTKPDTRVPNTSAPPSSATRATLSLVARSEKVVPLRIATAADRRPTLNSLERSAFHEIARALGARVQGEETLAAAVIQREIPTPEGAALEQASARPEPHHPETQHEDALPPGTGNLERAILDRLPHAIVAFRSGTILFANKAFLEWVGAGSVEALAAAGGADSLFVDPAPAVNEGDDGEHLLFLRHLGGAIVPVDGRLFKLLLDDAPAAMMVLSRRAAGTPRTVPSREEEGDAELRELNAILEIASDGVVVIDADGCVLSANSSATKLFGYTDAEIGRTSVLDLLDSDSRKAAVDYLGWAGRDVDEHCTGAKQCEREVIGRLRNGACVHLSMTLAQIPGHGSRFCAVFRDITHWKQTQEKLKDARRAAEKASSAKSDALARVSHEIRTPLSAIVGLSEVMMDERLGSIGNDRYRGYARDINASGNHMISLLNDLLDLSKVEAGRLDLTLAPLDLNSLVSECVVLMQTQASRERVIVRTALESALPPVFADTRSVRQILLNLLSNAIKFTGSGGQVILSTGTTQTGGIVLRVRDTGVGMSESDIEMALEPFRQLPTAAPTRAVGTGLGLPLTKAIAEANRATFSIKSAIDNGTLVEIVFRAAGPSP